MGVIVFILLSGRMPFSGESEMQISDIKKGKYTFKADYWSNTSQAAIDFTKAMLEVDPQRRLTAKTALEHAWLKKCFQAPTPLRDASILSALRSWALAPKLHRACMSMMAWSLTNQHHAQVRDHFLALNKSHDGAVSLEELKAALAGRNCEESEVFQIFDLLSHGHEDKIHYSDFLAAMVSTHLDVDDHLLQVTFKKFDRRASGFISSQDLRSILGSSFYGDDIEALIREADSDGDGKLSYEEFQKYLGSTRKQLIAQQTQQEKQATDVSMSNSVSGGALSRSPVLLGNCNGPMQKGPMKDSPFANNIGQHKVQDVSSVTTQKPPACCIVQ
jgi:Ca2+-binding EF-hand superfamily protein